MINGLTGVTVAGLFTIGVAFISAVVSTTAYYLYYRDRQESLLTLGNRTFIIMGAGVFSAMLLLLVSIMSHDFRLNYVYSYSSTILNNFYLFSTLWAGQEGTFLLWLLYGSIFGLILIKTAARKNPLVMVVILLVQSFLLLILLKKNPFAMIWHIHQEAPLGFLPADGAGLNPLLQNPWMVIHPPTLFIGYSSTVVPFAFAMAGMITRDSAGWIKAARPWVIFNVMILGTGIIMGGYWAYITLGWGGYWGWDPVENASIVPWVFGLALLHGIMVQTKRKSLIKTNYLLAGMSFLTMVWGSFLTRSGVLTDFSVHSFAPSGLSLYLVIFQGLFTGLFFAALAWFIQKERQDGEKPVRFEGGLLNRETFMLGGMLVLILLGVVILFGTSAPIYTTWLGKPQSVSPDFYNSMMQPIAFFMLIFVAIAPLLAWKGSEFRNLKTLAGSAGGAFVLTLLAAALGMRHVISIGLFFLAAFVIIINGKVAYRLIRQNFTKAGGYLAHVGLGFMAIGIITSSIYDSSEKVMLPKGEFADTEFGYQIQFVNFVPQKDGRDRVKLRVKTAAGGEYDAYPQFYYSEYSKSYMISPDVKMQFAKDIYISPISFTPAQFSNRNEVTLGKTESTVVGDMKITFNQFLVNMGANSQEITADLTVQVQEGGYSKEYNLKPVLKAENGEMVGSDVEVPNTPYRIRLASVNANSGQVNLVILSARQAGESARDMLAVEVSEKPLISILWFGAIIFVFGSLLILVNRARQE
ncbi:MAG: cytochrome c biogenesis protein CcsA [Calditrichaceae bacterium]|nr:cytochrome c biogenesis protein CcsA [Calditrichia bacterium]NUQ41476.1 cytochrome c biogenesis protein CcsA [Calditrichaceae bacterium]